jgi:Ca-activated chloride channel family protein
MSHGRYHIARALWILLLVEIIVATVLLGIWWYVLQGAAAFRFERPEWLPYLLIGPGLSVIFILHLLWRQRAMLRFSSARTLVHAFQGISTTRILVQFLLFRHGLTFILLALASPQFGSRLEEVKSQGVDVVVAVDVSNSMKAQDLKPDRMEVARRALSRLIDKLHGDRLGIVIFAGEAYVQLPITTDRSAARLFLSSISTSSVPVQGTAIGAAISTAQECFDLERPGGKAIIVITDGENHEDDAEGAAREAAKAGILVHTIGMGTPQGAPLPIERNGQITGFRKDRNGNTVVSRLNEQMLIRIAAAGNGSYVRATERSIGIEELVAELRSLDATETGSWQYTAHEAQFQYPLGIGLLSIIVSLMMSDRKRSQLRTRWTS